MEDNKKDLVAKDQVAAQLFGESTHVTGDLEKHPEPHPTKVAEMEKAIKENGRKDKVFTCDLQFSVDRFFLVEMQAQTSTFSQDSALGKYLTDIFGTHPLFDSGEGVKALVPRLAVKQTNHPEPGIAPLTSYDFEYSPFIWPGTFQSRVGSKVVMAQAENYSAVRAEAEIPANRKKNRPYNRYKLIMPTFLPEGVLRQFAQSAIDFEKKKDFKVFDYPVELLKTIKPFVADENPNFKEIGGLAYIADGEYKYYVLKDEFAHLGVEDVVNGCYRLDVDVSPDKRKYYAGANSECEFEKREEWALWIKYNNLHLQLLYAWYLENEELIKKGRCYGAYGYTGKYTGFGQAKVTGSGSQSDGFAVFLAVKQDAHGKAIPSQIFYRHSITVKGKYAEEHLWSYPVEIPKMPTAPGAPMPGTAPGTAPTMSATDYMSKFGAAGGSPV